MTQSKRYLVAAFCLVILMITGALMDTHRVVAQAPAPVTVVNTPLPVTGDMHISATSHRPLPVELTHMPTVGLAGGASVLVGNPLSNPVNIRDATEAMQPVSVGQAFPFSLPPGGVFQQMGFFTVPAGKRLVIEYVSGQCNLPAGQTFWVQLVTPGSFINTSQSNPASSVNASSATLGHVVRKYVDQGATLLVSVFRSDTTGSGSCFVSVEGHLVNTT